MHFTLGTTIKFTKSSKFMDFTKGETGVIQRVLGRFPYCTDTVYIIKLDNIQGPNNLVWATSAEVIQWNQLALL